jgi:hypothetical protein
MNATDPQHSFESHFRSTLNAGSEATLQSRQPLWIKPLGHGQRTSRSGKQRRTYLKFDLLGLGRPTKIGGKSLTPRQ